MFDNLFRLIEKKGFCPNCQKISTVKKLNNKKAKLNEECFCSTCYRVYIYKGNNKILYPRKLEYK